jgi:hypothetical protein
VLGVRFGGLKAVKFHLLLYVYYCSLHFTFHTARRCSLLLVAVAGRVKPRVVGSCWLLVVSPGDADPSAGRRASGVGRARLGRAG